MGGSQVVVCVLIFGLVLSGSAQGQPVGAPAVNGGFAPAPAPVMSTPAPTPAASGPPSYIAINCGGLTPANASIPQYYGGVNYGVGNGSFYQPNNSYVSTVPAEKGDIVFLTDRYYYGTSTKPRQYLGFAPLSGADGALYLTERYGLSFTYELDLPNGVYNVDLHFAETQFNQVGARVFSVTIQGEKSVPNLDIYATVGANTSLIVTRQATVSNGLLSILFETVSSNVNDGEAKVNAIRVYTNSSTNVPFPAPPSSYFIDVGASTSRVAPDGVNYTRDSFFSNGVAVAFTSAGAPSPLSVAQTTDPIVYSTARVGRTFSYYFNLPVGHYRVELAFVEGQFTQPGQRLFTVEIQGVQAFPTIDIIGNSSYALSTAPAPAPGSSSILYTPTSFNLTTAAAVANGLLRIDFNGTNGGNATVSAIKVTPLNANTNGALAIDCGSPIDVLSGNGVIFQADTNFSAASYSVQSNPYQVFLPYNDAVDDFLYPTVRQGNFTYNFSLPNGTYLVTLYFADLNATGPGQRIFDVYIQEAKVLTQLDVYARTGGPITAYIRQFPATVTSSGFLSIRFQSSPEALSLPNVSPQNYVLNGTNYVNTLYPPFVSALYVEPGIPPPPAPAPTPARTVVAQAPRPIGPPPPPGAPDPYFAYVNTPADLPQGPVPPVPTFGGAASENPSCPANGAPPQAINCTGPCPLWTPPFGLNVAVNTAGPRYVSSCGIVFEDDSGNSTRCGPGNVIPQGARWCRTNIKGPEGGFQFSTGEGIFNTSDPTIFQSEFIGYNTYKFRLPSPGVYQVYSYFAEVSGEDPVINVNRPNLRIFYIHFNGNNADAIGPIDPFVIAGEKKFHAAPAIGRGVQCSSNELSVEYEAVAAGRDAPAIKGIWVYGPVDANFNAMAPLGAQSPATPASSVIAPPPPVGVPPSPTSSAASSGAPTPAPTPSGS